MSYARAVAAIESANSVAICNSHRSRWRWDWRGARIALGPARARCVAGALVISV